MKQELKLNLGATKLVHRSVDQIMLQMVDKARGQGHRVMCRRGCGGCCSDVIQVLHVEIPIVVDAIRKMEPDRVRDVRSRLVSWTELMAEKGIGPDEETPPLVRYHELPKAFCPLLDRETQECLIYEARPLACRCHTMIDDDPRVCSERQLEPAVMSILVDGLVVKAAMKLVVEHMRRRSETVPMATGMLQYWLMRAWILVEAERPDYTHWLNQVVKGDEKWHCVS